MALMPRKRQPNGSGPEIPTDPALTSIVLKSKSTISRGGPSLRDIDWTKTQFTLSGSGMFIGYSQMMLLSRDLVLDFIRQSLHHSGPEHLKELFKNCKATKTFILVPADVLKDCPGVDDSFVPQMVKGEVGYYWNTYSRIRLQNGVEALKALKK